MYFASDRREATKEENPRAKFGELGKILGAAWNALDAEGRKVSIRSLSISACLARPWQRRAEGLCPHYPSIDTMNALNAGSRTRNRQKRTSSATRRRRLFTR
jgi:hypothetical protein